MATILGGVLLLLVFGFMGVYLFQHEETGSLGFLGFLLITISNCIALGECRLQNGEPAGVAVVLGPLVGITMLLGFILLGIGSWKANKLPRWTAVLWVLGGALIVLGFAVQEMLVAIGGVIQGAGVVGLASSYRRLRTSRPGNPKLPCAGQTFAIWSREGLAAPAAVAASGAYRPAITAPSDTGVNIRLECPQIIRLECPLIRCRECPLAGE